MQLHAEQVQRVIHANAHAQGDHRQGGDLDANTHGHHQRLAQHRGEHQWQYRHQGRAPATKGDQAEQRHCQVHQQQHAAVGVAHHDIGRRLDPGAAGRQQELAILAAVGLGKALGNRHHLIEGVGLVVLEVGDHRHQRAIVVEQFRGIDRGLLGGVVEHVLVALDAAQLGVALVGACGYLPDRVGQRQGGLHLRVLL
ncbi:hypothetical protein D3C81_1204340 [compost metagenome]